MLSRLFRVLHQTGTRYQRKQDCWVLTTFSDDKTVGIFVAISVVQQVSTIKHWPCNLKYHLNQAWHLIWRSGSPITCSGTTSSVCSPVSSISAIGCCDKWGGECYAPTDCMNLYEYSTFCGSSNRCASNERTLTWWVMLLMRAQGT